MAKTQDETYSNERTKPFPLTELDFSGELKGPPRALAPVVGRLWWSCHALPPWVSLRMHCIREAPCNAVYNACAGNQITGAGIGDVVQFARTQGCDATLVDLSKNLLDDDAALNELTRLVKNYGTFGSQNFLRELLLSSNKIGKAGATKLIQYAHWERERHAEEGRPTLKLDLSDNCVTDPEGEPLPFPFPSPPSPSPPVPLPPSAPALPLPLPAQPSPLTPCPLPPYLLTPYLLTPTKSWSRSSKASVSACARVLRSSQRPPCTCPTLLTSARR